MGVMGQDVGKPINPGIKETRAKSQVDDAGVRTTLPDHQLAEVSVIRDQDAPLTPGDVKHHIIGKPWLIILGNESDIMAERVKVASQAGIRALID